MESLAKRLLDTPFDELNDEESRRIKKEVSEIIGCRPMIAEAVAVRSVGVIGDAPSYDPTVFLIPAPWHVWSPVEMGALSTTIINQVKGVGRVMVDITPLIKK